jgi:hypothetical protein
MGLTRDNHFVPQIYLRNFATASGEVHEYRILVPHARARVWKAVNVTGTGYEQHLYTRIVRGKEVDDIEQWLNRDFESPAKEPFQKVIADKELTHDDWEILIRFLASQTVRTPAFLVKNLPRWNRMTQETLDGTFKEVEVPLRQAKASGLRVADAPAPPISEVAALFKEYVPMRVDRKDLPEKKEVQFSGNVVVGRGLWFFAMKLMLTRTLKVLQKHKWTILEAPTGLRWFTSDDPVIRLNFKSESNYDFDGGWGRTGGNILFPLSPRHLMFTQIGASSKMREVPSRYHARLFRRMIAEHAHRKIYSLEEDEKIPQLKPRVVDDKAFRNERLLWRTWYEDQSRAERSL